MAKEELKPIQGLYKLKKWVEDCGLKRAAVTNAPKENAEFMISTLGLSDFFEAVILGDDCEHAKPFPDPYLKALDILKVSKDHTVVFEVRFLSSFLNSICLISTILQSTLIDPTHYNGCQLFLHKCSTEKHIIQPFELSGPVIDFFQTLIFLHLFILTIIDGNLLLL